MFKIFTNKSADPQQIMTVDGNALTVSPGKSENIDTANVFPEEMTRLQKFFKIEEVPAPAGYKKTYKADPVAEKDGGDE